MRALKLTGQAVALAAVVALLALLIWRLTHQNHPPKIGGAAPNFTLARLEGTGDLALASLRGHPVVVNFWASWCVPCKGEAQLLEQQYAQYKKQGVVFLGIDYHDVASDARTFLEHHGITYPTLKDGSGAVGDKYGITGVPETYFISRTGRLVGVHVLGPITDSKFRQQFEQGLRAALNS